MSRDQLRRTRRSLLDRLSQPSAAAGLAALLALLVPEVAPHAPMLVELGLGAVAVAAAIVAMVRRERNGNGHDRDFCNGPLDVNPFCTYPVVGFGLLSAVGAWAADAWCSIEIVRPI